MAVELDRLPGVGVRSTRERRHGERRAETRTGPDRRRGERRQATLRTLLFGALTLAIPTHTSPQMVRARIGSALIPPPSASVTVSITGFTPIAPWRAYDSLIEEAAERYGVDPVLIRSVMQAESAFNPLAVSPAGAQGLMQLMPEVAEELGVTDPFDPGENIMAGTRHLRRMLDLHDGNVTLAVASYNAGAGAVARYGAVPPYRETQQYVRRVAYLLARDRSG